MAENNASIEGHFGPTGVAAKVLAPARMMKEVLHSVLALIGVATLVLIAYMGWTHAGQTTKSDERQASLIKEQTSTLGSYVKENALVQVEAIKELRIGQRDGAEATLKLARETRFQTCIYAMNQTEKRAAFVDENSLCNRMARAP